MAVDSANMTVTADQLQQAFARIRQWKEGDQRAPHKPLLLLLALGRVQQGEPRLAAFKDVEPSLTRLLKEFGPTRRTYHPEYPFWRLQADGLWEIPGGETLRPRESNNDPPKTEMRKVSGGFLPAVDELLRADGSLVRRLAVEVLDEHFPPSMHDSICAAVGLSLAAPVADELGATGQARRRDPAFRELVLRAYGYRCAICGMDAHLDGLAIGLEAAHVRWHAMAGPSTVDNGVCLCPNHHTAFDFGLVTLDGAHTGERRVLVSSRVSGGGAVDDSLVRHHGVALVGPSGGHPPVTMDHAAWHRAEVFKSPARAT